MSSTSSSPVNRDGARDGGWVRCDLPGLFFGMGRLAAFCLLFCRVYLWAEAIGDPLEASQTALRAAGVTLALASFSLIDLVWPRSAALTPRAVLRRPHLLRGTVVNGFAESAHACFDSRGRAATPAEGTAPL